MQDLGRVLERIRRVEQFVQIKHIFPDFFLHQCLLRVERGGQWPPLEPMET
jgi:hypothetical protein